jgi:hypothetical protein
MFEAVGYRMKRLIRIRMGPVRLGDLPQGHWRALGKRELNSLRDYREVVAAGADRGIQNAGHVRNRRGQRPRLQVK